MARRVDNRVDVIIPYKSTHDQLELRFALRSIDKNFKNLGTVYLVGDKPDWVRNVVHVYNSNKDHKRLNVGYALRMALWQDELRENIVIWHDDMFLLKELDTIPVWHGKSIKELSRLYNGIYPTSYYTRKIRTADIPTELPHFELHTPMPASKKLLAEQLGDHPPQKSYLMRTAYMIKNTDPKDWEYHEDVKIHSYPGSRGWQDQERFDTFVSSADNTFLGVILPILRKRLQEPSQFEEPGSYPY